MRLTQSKLKVRRNVLIRNPQTCTLTLKPGEAMDRLATSYGPVVRSSLLNSSSLPPSTDPDAILRRLRDQHNLRRRSLKSLVDLNYDLDVPEGDSDCDGDGGSYGGYFNESMERGDGDEVRPADTIYRSRLLA